MTKILTSLFISIFIFSNAAVFAQMPIAAPGVVSSLEGLSRIGVVAAIQGKVEVMTPGAAGRVVQSGEEIFIGDEVKTDAAGHLQILLLDETVFTIGPNSAITIDKFIYEPGTHVGKVEASITKGVFRYVSGKIAANKPENVSIKLPTATIGIRGTIVAGEVSATRSMAMLLGPGSKNETGATIGSFVMSGTGGNSGQQEHVNRTGFGVSVDQAGGLSGVFMVPEVQVQHLGESLLPAQGRGPVPAGGENAQGAPPTGRVEDQGPSGAQPPVSPASGTMPGAPATSSGPASPGPIKAPMMTTSVFGAGFNAGQASGAQTFAGFQMTNQVNMMGIFQNGLMQDTTMAAQDAAQKTTNQTTHQTVRDTLNSDMLARVAPVVTYQHVGGNFNFGDLQGTLSALIKVDFGSNMVIGSQSHIEIHVPDGISLGTPLNDSCLLSDQPFNSSNPSLPATFQWTGGQITQQGLPTFDSTGVFNQVTVQFQDVLKTATDGSTQVDIAAQAKVTVDYTRSAETGTGEVIAPQI
ncbi:MAG: FecR domain-containing protein [Candidatus Omnitrophota bacterium]